MPKKPDTPEPPGTPGTPGTIDTIIDAALSLARTRAWRDVTLNDIASEANLPLADLADHVASKSDVLRSFARRMDRALLRSLETDPVEGTVHDRLFDIIMRRFELMAPERAAIASIIDAPAENPADWAKLSATLLETQGWIAAAAGIESSGGRSALKHCGLAAVYARTLRVWAKDDDPGMARTMASLDRSLRDGDVWLKRLEAPAALGAALGGLARAFWNNRFGRDGKPAGQPDNAGDHSNRDSSTQNSVTPDTVAEAADKA